MFRVVAERGSMRNGHKHRWPLDCSGMSADCCRLSGVKLCGSCAEMVVCVEGKECQNPSGDNRELSFEASDHTFGYECTEK